MSADRDREHAENQHPSLTEDSDPLRPTERLPALDPDVVPTQPAPPPLDLDERDAEPHRAEPPDVIELPDQSERGETVAPDDDFPEFHPEEATGESPDAATVELQEAWQSDTYIDPDTVDDLDSSSTDLPGQDPPTAPRQDPSSRIVTVVQGPRDAPTDAEGAASSTRTVTLKAERETHPNADTPHVHETVTDERPPQERGDASGGRERIDTRPLDRVLGMLQQFIQPALHLHWTASYRQVLLGGALLILLALLASSAGLALIIATAMVAILMVLGLSRQDVFEHESATLISGVGVIGGIIGVIVGTLGSWLASSSWFESGQLNYGAGGFGGRFADGAGSAPFAVWLLNGLILPLIALAAIAVAPVGLRRMPQFRNEVMDGVILVGASAAGFAIGTALIYWAPMLGGRGPQTSVRDWTLTTIGVVLLRPVVITLAGAMLGAGIWRYMSSPGISSIVVPAAGGIGAFLLLMLGSIQLGPAGLWPETIWTLLLVAVTFVVYRTVLRGALATDRSVLGEDGTRIVCPHCQQLTPPGTFCANCGKELPDAEAATGARTEPNTTLGDE